MSQSREEKLENVLVSLWRWLHDNAHYGNIGAPPGLVSAVDELLPKAKQLRWSSVSAGGDDWGKWKACSNRFPDMAYIISVQKTGSFDVDLEGRSRKVIRKMLITRRGFHKLIDAKTWCQENEYVASAKA